MAEKKEIVETEHQIRDKLTDTYSTGGQSPYFTTRGKTWKSHRALMLHLAMFNGQSHYGNKLVENLEIVTNQRTVIVNALPPEPLGPVLGAQQERKRKRVVERKLARAKSELAQITARKAQLEKELANGRS